MGLSCFLGGYSHEQLATAFGRVADKENWRMPIRAALPLTTPVHELEKISFAVRFFTGSETEIRRVGSALLITAPGYFNAAKG